MRRAVIGDFIRITRTNAKTHIPEAYRHGIVTHVTAKEMHILSGTNTIIVESKGIDYMVLATGREVNETFSVWDMQ